MRDENSYTPVAKGKTRDAKGGHLARRTRKGKPQRAQDKVTKHFVCPREKCWKYKKETPKSQPIFPNISVLRELLEDMQDVKSEPDPKQIGEGGDVL